MPWLIIVVLALCALASVIRHQRDNQKNEKELESLRTAKEKQALILPELEQAITLMYKGQIKDARTKLCRLRNTLA
jgi:hypothetical protein